MPISLLGCASPRCAKGHCEAEQSVSLLLALHASWSADIVRPLGSQSHEDSHMPVSITALLI